MTRSGKRGGLISGRWVFICGPSGAGKDSVIASAQQTLADRSDIVFARRIVSRPMQVGSDHDPLTPADFLALQQAGGLRWHWQAHGFDYGIAQHYANDVQAGRSVVVNGSRAHVLDLPPSSDIRWVQISAEPERLAARLLQRGRDGAAAVAERLARNTRFSAMQADCVIVNDADLASAGQRLADYLSS